MDLSVLPTYQACVLQARAYRTLRIFMEGQLKAFNLTMMEWVMLGLVVADENSTYTMTDLADLIDVGQPLITNMVNRVSEAGLVARVVDRDDKRSKHIKALPKGVKLAAEVEDTLRRAMREWLSDIPRAELEGYVKMMMKLAQKNPHI